MNDPNHLFTLRVWTSDGMVTIRAYDANDNAPGCYFAAGARIDVEVRHKGRVIFKRGDTWCRTPAMGGMSLDGDEARELVMSLVAMRPGDTDDDYFAGYTPEQLAWADRFGEEIGCEREARYCCPECGSFGKDHCRRTEG